MKFFILLFSFSQLSQAKEILTNSSLFQNPPPWLTSTRINRIADHIQSKMEWSIRRTNVIWFTDEISFQNAHKLGPVPIAVTNKTINTIYLGPKVGEKNFDQVFGHELVHIISFQKYKESIPKWLEEGFANHLSKSTQVDYTWLKQQKIPQDARTLIHPLNGSITDIKTHYVASQALVEMLANKCDLNNLMRMSVGRNMETYIKNMCQINDLNKSFEDWILKKSL